MILGLSVVWSKYWMTTVRQILRTLWAAILAVLWFANVLEPPVKNTPPMLSLSKVYMWLMVPLTVVAVMTPGNADMVVALSGLSLGIGNYAFRRFMQVKTKTGGYALVPVKEEDAGPE